MGAGYSAYDRQIIQEEARRTGSTAAHVRERLRTGSYNTNSQLRFVQPRY